jgi:signal transduction histidine kinase
MTQEPSSASDATIIENPPSRAREGHQPAISVTWQSDIASRRISYAGPQAVRLLGFPLAAWYEEGFWEGRLARDDREHVTTQRRAEIERGADIDLVYRMITATGTHVLVRELATVVPFDDGASVLRGLFLSVSESLDVGEMSDNVKAFAAFAGHELSQPLGAVLANAEAMKRLLASDPPRLAEARDALEDVIASARQSVHLVSAMRQSAR